MCIRDSTKAAKSAPGVLNVLSHLNKPSAAGYEQEGGSPIDVYKRQAETVNPAFKAR